jgi:hypothetical protein
MIKKDLYVVVLDIVIWMLQYLNVLLLRQRESVVIVNCVLDLLHLNWILLACLSLLTWLPLTLLRLL